MKITGELKKLTQIESRFLVLLLIAATAVPLLAGQDSFHEVVPGERLSIRIDASPVSALTYQLDCLGGVEHACSKERFEHLWKESLGWQGMDDDTLQRWVRLRNKYSGQVGFPGQVEHPAYPPRFYGIDYGNTVQFAGFESTNIDEYSRYLSILVNPADEAQMTSVLQHFWARFEKWWVAGAGADANRFVEQSAALMRRAKIGELYSQAAQFYESDLPRGTEIRIHVMPMPVEPKGPTSARRIQNHATVEVPTGETPEKRLDVVSHEIFHFLYVSTPEEKLDGVARSLIAYDSPTAPVAFALLDEAVATALGNGIVGQQMLGEEKFKARLAKPRSLYNDDAIDGTAKRIYPSMKSLLESGEKISGDRFIKLFAQAAQQTLAEPGFRANVYLRDLNGAFEPEFRSSVQELIRASATNTSSAWDSVTEPEVLARFKEFPYSSGVVFVTNAGISKLKEWEPMIGKTAVREIGREARKRRAFAYAARRSPKSFVFVFVGSNPEALRPVIKSFVENCRIGQVGICGE